MDNEHLVNCIFYTQKHADVYDAGTRNLFIQEANYRGLSWTGPTDYAAKKRKIEQIRARVTEESLSKMSVEELGTLYNKIVCATK